MKVRGFENVTGSNVPLPVRKTGKSAGYDFVAPCDIYIPAHGTSNIIMTGIKAYMPDDEYLELHIRSSLATKKHIALACGGIIDADYYNNADNEGNIGIAFFNYSAIGQTIKAGERMAQGIFVKYGVIDNDNVKVKREGGFGSTGR